MVENERMAKVEQAIENIDKGFTRLEQKFDSVFAQIEKRYVPRTENLEVIKRLESRLDEQDYEIKDLKNKQSRHIGYIVTLAGSMIIGMVQYFLTK